MAEQSEKLSWEEIQKRYPDEWVELIDCDWDETEPDPRSGVVRVHSKDRKEFHKLVLQDSPAESALVYVGELFPKRENVSFWANANQYRRIG